MDALADTLPAHVRNDPVIAEVKQAIAHLYGERLARLLLYGSRARGDMHQESDYDLLVLLHGELDKTTEQARINAILRPIEASRFVLVMAMAMPENALEQRTGFMWNVRLEALEL